MSVKFHWYDTVLVIENPTAKMEKFLVWDKKKLVLDKRTFTRRSKIEKVKLFNVWHEGSKRKGRVIETPHGFKDQLILMCKKEGEKWELFDKRIPVKAPKLGLTGGFRLEQQPLFEEFIGKNQSGILQAPTRYGKSIMIINTMRAFPNMKTVVAAPGVDLLNQTVDDFKKALPERDIKGVFTGSKNRTQSADITICSLDSLHKMDTEGTHLLLIDEPHAAVSETRAPVIARFKNARIYGFGATLTGRYDNADKLLTGLVGPVLAKRTFREAVSENAICDIEVYMVRFPFEAFSCRKRELAYKRLLYENQIFIDAVGSIANSVLPKNWQTIIFVDQQKQADLLADNIDEAKTVIAGRMKIKERKETFQNMVNNHVKRCICTDVYAQGVTFPDLRVMINAAGGGGSISSTQKPGRLAQIRENKNCGYLVDFLFECSNPPKPEDNVRGADLWRMVANDSMLRLRQYDKLGYKINVINSLAEITMT
jgi:superfamily II DNA or RNA helicase